MKKILLFIFVTLIVTVTLIACKAKTQAQYASNVRLIERFFGSDENYAEYQHDDKNRIVRILYRGDNESDFDRVITYVNDNKIKLNIKYVDKVESRHDQEFEFTVKGNTITFATHLPGTITLNEQGYIIKEEYKSKDGNTSEISNYEYQDGNLISIKQQNIENGEIYRTFYSNFRTDNMKSPFYEDKTPRWLIQYINGGLSNNIIYTSDNYSDQNREYEYDTNGFPTRELRYWSDGGEDYYYLRFYKYRGIAIAENHISENELTALAKRAFDLQVQLDRSNSKEPLISEELRQINAKVKSMPKIEQIIYNIESDSNFKGYDPNEESFTEQQYIESVQFAGKIIPITVFRVPVSYYGFDGFSTYKLEFLYDNNRQAINLLNKEWGIEIDGFLSEITVDDFNFDNYMDIGILSSGTSYNRFFETFLYNPQTKKYFHHNELSKVANPLADKESRTLKSHMKGGHAGALYHETEYRWQNNTLVLIQSINQDFDNDTEKYVRITKKLQADGSWSEQTEFFKYEELY